MEVWIILVVPILFIILMIALLIAIPIGQAKAEKRKKTDMKKNDSEIEDLKKYV